MELNRRKLGASALICVLAHCRVFLRRSRHFIMSTPPPSLEQLQQLQLKRQTLLRAEAADAGSVMGYVARVSLPGPGPAAHTNYVVAIQGMTKGEPYAFEGGNCDWYLQVEKPVELRHHKQEHESKQRERDSNKDKPPDNRIREDKPLDPLRLTSVSDRDITVAEYDAWVNACRELKRPFPSATEVAEKARRLVKKLVYLPRYRCCVVVLVFTQA